MSKTFLLMAAISGFLVVALGAFGAHGLKEKISSDLLAVYQTGVLYQMFHTLALLAVALLLTHSPQLGALRWSGWLFAAGILIFSGSLYLLALTGVRWLGAITPIGGVAFLGGWLSMIGAAWQWMK
jgi:uncharacterized membrane protein YgdD (TMEM256/DUF423 family)